MIAALPPHDWDDEANRLAIHTAFDVWLACFLSVPQNKRQVTHWQKVLADLTGRASERKARHDEQLRIGEEFRRACDAGLAGV